MATHSSPIPSRNALRALRRLAYGGSTIIGAVGSILAAATVNHDTQRRIRLAERLIETKRTIRSVSNSNGPAHVARMFEAAERGEDFGVEATRTQKRQARRRRIAAADEDGGQSQAGDWLAGTIRFDGRVTATGETSSGSHNAYRWGTPVGYGDGTMIDSNLISPASFETTSGSRRRDSAGERGPVSDRISYRRGTPVGFGKRTMMCPDIGVMASFETTTSWNPYSNSLPPPTPQMWPAKHTDFGNSGKDRGKSEARTNLKGQSVDHTVNTEETSEEAPAIRLNSDVIVPKDVASKESLSAANRIMEATRRQHKLRSHTVYGRPGRPNSDGLTDLNRHVDLWLKGDEEILELSVPKARYDGRADQISDNVGPREHPKAETRNVELDVVDPQLGASHAPFSKVDESQVLSLANLLRDDTRIQKETSASYCQTNTAGVSPDEKPFGDPTKSTDLETTFDQPFKTWLPFQPRVPNQIGGLLRPGATSPAAGSHKTVIKPLQACTKESIDKDDFNQPLVPANTAPIVQWSPTVMRPVFAPDTKASLGPLEGHDVDEASFWTTKNEPRQSSLGNTNAGQPAASSSYQGTLSIGLRNQKAFVEESRRQSPMLPDYSDSDHGLDEAFQLCLIHCRTKGSYVWEDLISRTLKWEGQLIAKEIWLKAMSHYASSDSADWALVQHLYEKFPILRPTYINPRPVQRLTRHLLETSLTCQVDVHRFARLLFPFQDRIASKEAGLAFENIVYVGPWKSKDIYANARTLIEEIWDEGPDSAGIISVLRKMIRAAKVMDIELAEDLFFTTILRLSSSGQVDQAQALFDEMRYYHQVQPSFFTRSTLVRGYARINDWDRVAREIEMMHNEDLSRQEPIGYASMFNSVLEDYASKRPVAQVHEFLVNALGYWGLVPTSAISATAIKAYLTYHRYDLVREWVETVRILFPQVDTETSAFAWNIGTVWDEVNASCQEVEEACKAISYPRRVSALSVSLKDMAREALARDLAAKLHAVDAATRGEQIDARIENSRSLGYYYEHAQSLALKSPTEAQGQTVQSPEALELFSQTASVARLDGLFQSHKKASISLPVSALRSAKSHVPNKGAVASEFAHMHSHLPQELHHEHLPIFSRLRSLVDEYYAARHADGSEVNHAIIKYVCRKLNRQDRLVDASKLIETIFQGAYVQGPSGQMFDLPIMETWLKLALDLKSRKTCTLIFAAVLQSKNDFKLTRKFYLLAKLTATRLRTDRFTHPDSRNPEKAKEFDWLLSSLKNRLDCQTANLTWRAEPVYHNMLNAHSHEIEAF